MTHDLLLTEEKPARRGFLRSLVMAPAAALATHKLILPAQALVTPSDASARLQHHLAGLEAAYRDLYPEGEWLMRGGADALSRLARGELAGGVSIVMRTAPLDGIAAYIRDEALKRGIQL